MTTLTYKIRRDEGKCMIAPFINGWNVWEIEERHWTSDVQYTIKHAYELGYKQALASIDVSNYPYLMNQPFIEDSNE